MLRVRPVNLTIEVLAATPRFDSSPDRYLVEVRVLEPQSKKNSVLHLMVDDLTEDRRRFVLPRSRWTVSCDEEAFEHERRIGFSFWFYRSLAPKPEPNQALEPTSLLVTPRAGARVAPISAVAHL